MNGRLFIAAAAIGLLACATTPQQDAADDDAMAGLAMMLGGGAVADDAKVAEVEAAGPLGSEENPVRAHMPRGERAYMASLRCLNGEVPTSERAGSAGRSPYGGVLDIYAWSCPGGEEGVVFIDMYHPDHVETRPPGGQALRHESEI